MTSSAFSFQPRQPLIELLDREFSQPELARQLGGVASQLDSGHFDQALCAPVRDFLCRPGKEFRARLVELCWQLSGGHGSVPEKLASIVEALHAGSLIVDDIEDESPTRRGRPALHVTYGLPVALNSGNWLYFWAFALVEKLDLGSDVELALYRWLSRTLTRCHAGQALDLTVVMSKLQQREVPTLVEATTRLKTGALMGLSAVMPALASGASQQVVSVLRDFGERLGIGLQMLDDLGGLTCERRCHKGHEDLIHGRPTWPWAWLAQEVTEISYLRLQQKAREVEARHLHPELLAEQMRQALGAEVKQRIARHLAQTLQMLPQRQPALRGFHELSEELERLMLSYD